MKSRSLWFYVAAITGVWHLARGAYPDAVVFLGAAIVVELDFRGIRHFVYRKIPLTRFALAAGTTAAFVILTFSTRYGVLDRLVLALVALFAYAETWHPDPRREQPRSDVLRRSIVVWSALVIVLGMIELSAYILAVRHGGDDVHFPTITVLVDPALERYFGRAVFTALWLLAGIRLLRPRVGVDKS